MLKKFNFLKGYSKDIKKVLWMNAFLGVSFSIPILVIFWQENGLTLQDIAILQAFLSIFILITKIPNGYLSDKWGRKNILILGIISAFIGNLIFSISSDFYGFLLAEFFLAIYISLFSGTISALVYEILKKEKKEKEYKKIWGNMIFFQTLFFSFSVLLGGFIADFDLRYTFYFTLLFILFALFLAFFINEPKIKTKKIESKRVEFKKFLKVFSKNYKLQSLILYISIITCFFNIIFWFYQPYFEILKIDIIFFGIIYFAFSIVSSLFSKYTYKIEKYLSKKNILILIFLIPTLSYFLMSYITFWWGFLLIFLIQASRGMFLVLSSNYIHDLADENLRATTLSIKSSFSRIIYFILFPFFGYLADLYSLQQSIFMMAIFSLVLGAFSIFFMIRAKFI